MKKVIVISIFIVFGLLITAISFIIIRSDAIIKQKYNVRLVDVVIPKDTASLAPGQKQTCSKKLYILNQHYAKEL